MSSRAGSEHLTEFKPDFHERLAFNWPEPREQLHIGGWALTRSIAEIVMRAHPQTLLDICCGEGGTACWLARTYPVQVFGIDIIEKAVARAQQHCSPGGAPTFVAGNIFDLPFASATFDAILGQDPDGLAHANRAPIFAECLRVLRPQGRIVFHHWMLHDEAPAHIVRQYNDINAELGFPSLGRLQIGDYVEDMAQSKFTNIKVIDLSHLYQQHMRAMERMANRREPGSLDTWTQTCLEIMARGHKIGAMIIAQKDA